MSKAKTTTPVVEETKTEKPVVKSKATKGASLKKLMRIAKEAVSKARKANPALKVIEADAARNLIEVRELVGLEPNGNLSVFGNMMHGMSGRLDQALMAHDPSEFAAILTEIAKGENHARRSATNEHDKLVKHAIDHLKRVSGNGINSAKKFDKPLAKVGMNHKTEHICNLMAPTLVVFQAYAAELES